MGIGGGKAIRVANDDHVAVPAEVARIGHISGASGPDRRPRAHGEHDFVVVARPTLHDDHAVGRADKSRRARNAGCMWIGGKSCGPRSVALASDCTFRTRRKGPPNGHRGHESGQDVRSNFHVPAPSTADVVNCSITSIIKPVLLGSYYLPAAALQRPSLPSVFSTSLPSSASSVSACLGESW